MFTVYLPAPTSPENFRETHKLVAQQLLLQGVDTGCRGEGSGFHVTLLFTVGGFLFLLTIST